MDAYKKICYCVFKCFCGCVFIVSPRPKPLLRPFAEVLMKVVLKPRLHFLRMQWCTAHHHWTLAVRCVQYLSDCVVSGLSLCFRSWALTRNDSYRSTYVCELLPGEVFDQAADQGAFPDLRGANNDNHNWRRFQGSPVYNRHVVFFGFYVLGPFWGTNKNKHQHSLKTWTWLILLCNAQHWPVEGFGHADRRLNCKCFGVAFAFILLCWAILFL